MTSGFPCAWSSCEAKWGQAIQPSTRMDAASQELLGRIDSQSDQDLLAAIGRGDRTALAQLYDRHAPQMLAVASRILQDRRDAEDLLHDVFLEAWQKADSYDGERGTVRTWLLMRVRSRAIDRMRTHTAAREHGMVLSHVELGAALEDPSAAPDRVRARRALASLPHPQRLVIELCYFEGLTCQEVADRCGVPLGTVKSRLLAAMMKLRQEFIPVRGAG